MEGEDLDTRTFYQLSYALLPTVSQSNLKGITLHEPSRKSKYGKVAYGTQTPALSMNDKFTVNCQQAFLTFSRQFNAGGSKKQKGIPFEELHKAVSCVISRIREQDIKDLANKLVWNSHELVSYEEFQHFCWQLFQNYLTNERQFAPEIYSPTASLSKNYKSVDSYDKLARKQHYVSTTPYDTTGTHQPVTTTTSVMTKASSTGGLSALEKDAVCEVMKKENREKRRSNRK